MKTLTCWRRTPIKPHPCNPQDTWLPSKLKLKDGLSPSQTSLRSSPYLLRSKETGLTSKIFSFTPMRSRRNSQNKPSSSSLLTKKSSAFSRMLTRKNTLLISVIKIGSWKALNKSFHNFKFVKRLSTNSWTKRRNASQDSTLLPAQTCSIFSPTVAIQSRLCALWARFSKPSRTWNLRMSILKDQLQLVWKPMSVLSSSNTHIILSC